MGRGQGFLLSGSIFPLAGEYQDSGKAPCAKIFVLKVGLGFCLNGVNFRKLV